MSLETWLATLLIGHIYPYLALAEDRVSENAPALNRQGGSFDSRRSGRRAAGTGILVLFCVASVSF